VTHIRNILYVFYTFCTRTNDVSRKIKLLSWMNFEAKHDQFRLENMWFSLAGSKYCRIRYALAWLQFWSLGSNKLQGVGIYPLINYFFIKIDFDWLKHNKYWARFQKTECFKIENDQKGSLIKVLLLTLYSSMKKIFRWIWLIF
jgi:hypothetical protein